MNNNLINNGQNSDDELNKLAPSLAAIKKSMNEGLSANPFTAPDGYFDSLSSVVMNKIEAVPDFESSSPENPFKVPSGYFETLPSIIQQRIIDQKAEGFNVSVWIAGFVSRRTPKYALAFASVAFVILFSVLYFTRTERVEYAEQEVPESEQFDEAYLQLLDESDLADLYTQESSSEPETLDEGIEKYLIDNDIDLNSISDQL